ncbi:MAG: SUMF1/EgtB/PvdO family nonheme iron enzyme [Synechococcus sp.]
MPIPGNKSERTKVFVSYSHADKNALEELQKFIKPLERKGVVDLWDDTKIPTGSKWKGEIERALDEAKVAVFLVSANFLASDFIHEEELPKLLSASENNGLIILPFFLSHCYYEPTPLADYQAVNSPDKPLSDFPINEHDRQWKSLIEKIDFALNQIKPDKRVEAHDNYTEPLGIGVELEMIAVPGDSFWMGSPDSDKDVLLRFSGPQHGVTVSPFWMGKFTVTQKQWMKVASYPKIGMDLKPQPSEFLGEDRPVESISWHEAVEFCERLSQRTNKYYRLPSEAEWEYACRAGTTTPSHFGQEIPSGFANCAWEFDGTTKVGKFQSNPFGLYDMHGNVWEWCADHWHKNYDGAPSGGTPWIEGGDGSSRILRGGSWHVTCRTCFSAFRHWNASDYRSNNIGFRVVCSSA